LKAEIIERVYLREIRKRSSCPGLIIYTSFNVYYSNCNRDEEWVAIHNEEVALSDRDHIKEECGVVYWKTRKKNIGNFIIRSMIC